ncbi:MAG: ETC complex I subunit [bacterium]|nr:ETC complex I subunit [bacterium]
MKARLYCPTQKATQSGKRSRPWILEIGSKPLYKESVMGWTGSSATDQALHLKFSSKERALAYIREHSLSCQVIERKSAIFRPKSYADNFRHGRLH